MTPQRKSRHLFIGAALAALLAPLAVVAGLSSPAQAAVGPRQHHVKTYKVEAHVDLSGEYPDNSLHTHLNCNNGDYALDGMWRVDHVDQANPDLDMYGDERDVQVDASYSDPVDPSMWHFRFVNNADGNAQLKIFLTCLDNVTENQHGHSHPITLGPLKVESNAALADGAWTHDYTSDCLAGEIPVAPGFDFTSGSGRIYQSWPSNNLMSWHWGFVVSGSPSVNVAFRCLKVKTAAAGPNPQHAHNLYAVWDSGWNGLHYNVPVNTGYEVRHSCNHKFYDKGMVAGFWIDDPFHTWWLGMDPRPKTRAFKYWVDGGSGSVWSTLLCIGSRTGKQIAP